MSDGFTADEEELFARRYENGYNLTHDSRYNQWLENKMRGNDNTTKIEINYYHSLCTTARDGAAGHKPAISRLAKFLTIPVPPGNNKKNYVNSGARVLTSEECMHMLEEKQRKKKEAAEEKEKRKFEREEKKQKKELEQTTRKKGVVTHHIQVSITQAQTFFAEID